jgi:hypothetical protein
MEKPPDIFVMNKNSITHRRLNRLFLMKLRGTYIIYRSSHLAGGVAGFSPLSQNDGRHSWEPDKLVAQPSGSGRSTLDLKRTFLAIPEQNHLLKRQFFTFSCSFLL